MFHHGPRHRFLQKFERLLVARKELRLLHRSNTGDGYWHLPAASLAPRTSSRIAGTVLHCCIPFVTTVGTPPTTSVVAPKSHLARFTAGVGQILQKLSGQRGQLGGD